MALDLLFIAAGASKILVVVATAVLETESLDELAVVCSCTSLMVSTAYIEEDTRR
jgi:hypothetical protein